MTDAPGTLSTWGTAIKARFDLDNLHLMQREADAGAVQIQSALQQMGRQVSSLHTQVANLVEAVASLAPAMLPAGVSVAFDIKNTVQTTETHISTLTW